MGAVGVTIMSWYRRVFTSDDGTEVVAQITSDFAALGSPKEMLLLEADQGAGKVLYLRMPARLAPVYDGFSEANWAEPPGNIQFLVGHADEFDLLIARPPS
jgi:hypothetical protein